MSPLNEIEEEIRAIREDRLSGARELAKKGAKVFIALAEGSKAANGEGFRRELSKMGCALIKAQPSMASLVNLVNKSLFAIQEGMDLEEAKRALITTAQGYADHLERNVERIAQAAFPLLPEGALVLTHSFSSTVLTALLHAKQSGRTFAVLCPESRPQYEGRILAERLAQAGVESQLVVDALAASMVKEAELVLVGGDSISTQGLTNKAGTYPLALAAMAKEIPFYALCGTEKFLPAEYPPPSQRQKNPREVWPEYPKGVEVLNYYFDLTPLDYFTGVVTENGVLSPSEVRARLKRSKLHPFLKG